jgi:hypothetical protein
MTLKRVADKICGLTDRQWWLFTNVNTAHQIVSEKL